MNKLVTVCILLALAGCGVKKREAGNPAVTHASALPEGVFITKGRGFIVRAEPLKLVPGEDNTVTFRIVDATLKAPPADLTFEVRYDMPFMPEMGRNFNGNAVVRESGRVESTLGIAHGGIWEVRLRLLRAGQEIDSVTYRVDVPNQ